MVEISISGCSQLQGSEADIIEGFIIYDHAFIGVLDELMDRESGVVWFNDCV